MTDNKKSLNKPSIFIFCNQELKKNELISQIGYGIEEEGIPFQVFLKKDNSVYNLAYTAAQGSKLGIGIGIAAPNKAVLQLEKLSKKNPVFDKEIDNFMQAKIMGINAARLEKKIPFKEFEAEED